MTTSARLERLIGGSCLCGEVAFEFDGPVLEFELDHCSRCRKATGSAFASELQVTLESFRCTTATSGLRSRFRVRFGSALHAEHRAAPPRVTRRAASVAPRSRR